MVTIQLEPDQAVMLREMLEGYLGDLRMEVAQTDLMDVREDLKKKEALLKDLISRLGAARR